MGCRMDEFQAFGVEVEPCSGFAIERVAEDGRVQSLGMGGVYAELVRPSRLGIESDAGDARSRVVVGQYFVARDGGFPVFVADYLARTVQWVGEERKRDESLVFRRATVEESDVSLADCLILELRL